MFFFLLTLVNVPLVFYRWLIETTVLTCFKTAVGESSCLSFPSYWFSFLLSVNFTNKLMSTKPEHALPERLFILDGKILHDRSFGCQ